MLCTICGIRSRLPWCLGMLCTIYGIRSRLPWPNYMKGRNRHEAVSKLRDNMNPRLRVPVLLTIPRWNTHRKHEGNYGDALSDDHSYCCSNLRLKCCTSPSMLTNPMDQSKQGHNCENKIGTFSLMFLYFEPLLKAQNTGSTTEQVSKLLVFPSHLHPSET